MRAAIYNAPYSIDAQTVPDPTLQTPSDVIVQITAAAVCGSDLWTYRGQSTALPGSRIGHEFVGEVVEVGSEVKALNRGDWVISPFRYSDGVCVHCRSGLESSCLEGGFWGRQVTEAGQAQLVRVPFAETTLVKALSNGERPPAALVPHLLTLADVYPTGLHAAVKAGVGPGLTTVVIGDGAVGLCAVLAARSLGAEQIIAFGGDYADRRALAQKFGATVVQPVRGAEAEAAVAEITNGVGADCVLECVGTAAAFASGLKMTRPGGTLGYVGLPHGVTVDMAELFPTNITISGGIAPARHYIPEVLPAVLKGDVTPGDVFTAALPLEQIDQAYQLMDQRSTIKVLIEPQKDNHASLS